MPGLGYMSNLPLVTILILNYNGLQVIKKCIEKVYCQTYPNKEVIVIDNFSTDNSVEIITKLFPMVKIVQTGKNLGYAGGNNFGVHFAKGEYFAFLNNDAYPEAEWLSNTIPLFLSDSSVAVVGCKIYKAESTKLDSAGAYIDFPIGFAPGRGCGLSGTLYNKTEELAYVSGAAIIIKKTVFEKLNGFDSDYFCYHEEVDFCWRARIIGYKTVYTPNAIVYHEVSHSLGEVNLVKEYFIERNRIITNLKNLERLNLTHAFFYETIYALGKVMLSVKLRNEQIIIPYSKALMTILTNFKIIWTKRLLVQTGRKFPDKYVLQLHRRRSIVEYIKTANVIYQ